MAYLRVEFTHTADALKLVGSLVAISVVVSLLLRDRHEDRLQNTVNLYEPPNTTLYALKLSLIVMEAQNIQALLKIVLHCHASASLLRFCFRSFVYRLYPKYDIPGDNFFTLKKSELKSA